MPRHNHLLPRQGADVNVVADLINLLSKKWKEGVISTLFDPQVAHAILAIPISQNEHLDRLIWYPSRTSNYNVKSGYIMANQNLHLNDYALASSSLVWNTCGRLKSPTNVSYLGGSISKMLYQLGLN